MIQPSSISMTLHYINGESYEFEFTPGPGEQANLVSRIQRLLNSTEIILELEDRVLIIPMNNIQAIEIAPPLEKLPDTAIRNVRQLD